MTEGTRGPARADGGTQDDAGPPEHVAAAFENEPRVDESDEDTAPEAENAIASVDDFAVTRDAEGELLPVTQDVPGTETPCPECGGQGTIVPRVATGLDDVDEDDAPEPMPCPECDAAGVVPKKIRVRPITQGEANAYLPSSGNPQDMDDDAILDVLHEFVVEPDMSGVTDVDDLYAFGVDPLLFAVMQASGFDLAKGMLTENSGLAEVIEGNSSRGN